MPDESQVNATLAEILSTDTHHGNELAPGPAREPELAGNRLVHHPCLLHGSCHTGRTLYALGQPVLAACRALFQFQAQLAAVTGVRPAAGIDAILGAPERAVLVLVQRLLQRLARP
ncbi:hypothetical protein D3C80_913170 [compost metagenome]